MISNITITIHDLKKTRSGVLRSSNKLNKVLFRVKVVPKGRFGLQLKDKKSMMTHVLKHIYKHSLHVHKKVKKRKVQGTLLAKCF